MVNSFTKDFARSSGELAPLEIPLLGEGTHDFYINYLMISDQLEKPYEQVVAEFKQYLEKKVQQLVSKGFAAEIIGIVDVAFSGVFDKELLDKILQRNEVAVVYAENDVVLDCNCLKFTSIEF